MLSPFLIPVVAILATFAYLMVQAVAQSLAEAKKHRTDAELKIALADRGMTADEIERVVAAAPGRKPEDAVDASARQAPTVPLPPRKHPGSPSV